MHFDYFSWIILPLLIFISRLGDVTMATLRHIFISKGLKKIVPVLGFFEVLIWLVAMRQVFSHLDNAACFIAWAAGFSAGTYLGMYIEERLAIGTQIIRVITAEDISPLVEILKKRNQGITIVDGHGALGPVKLIFTIVKRTNKAKVIELIRIYTPKAFYSIEDVKGSERGIFTDKGETTAIKRLFSINAGK
ncbi:MAG: hypothetical protein K0S53_1826 [Bacteroidetes bacterium]|jgi:uncharacterized protein YebE (UPF0316 family)|nr:hypothetical protein [Bacteroidota bacterium]MDF2451477.1 hypothetical protein [Bacteroidota bacterium]